jgi:hypothetical protein
MYHAYRIYYNHTYYVVSARNVKEAIKAGRKAHCAFVHVKELSPAAITKIERLDGGEAILIAVPPGTNPEPITVVIFRWWEGDVIALFPEEPASSQDWHLCNSYQHVGQHSGADPWLIIEKSRPATRKEYLPLLKALRQIGYKKLLIKNRHTDKMKWIRRRNWFAFNANVNPAPQQAADIFTAAMGGNNGKDQPEATRPAHRGRR